MNSNNNLEPIQIINFNSSKNKNSKQDQHHEIIDYDNSSICEAINCNNNASIILNLPIAGTNSGNYIMKIQVCNNCKSKFE